MLFDLVEPAKNPTEDAAAADTRKRRPSCRPPRRGGLTGGRNLRMARRLRRSRTSIHYRKTLPAHKEASNVIDTVSKYQVMLIEGGTGCGKTTQVPQFLLDSAEGPIKIVVAQPRRVAAVGVASRVAEERGENVGQTVGVAVRGEVAMGSHLVLYDWCVTTTPGATQIQGCI